MVTNSNSPESLVAPGNLDASWWHEAFPAVPYESKPPGAHEMLIVIAYDITEPARLARIAKICKDYGVRVQYSVFECHLSPEDFRAFWERLKEEIEPATDRVVAYPLDAKAAREVLTLGTMACNKRAVCYLV